MPLTNATKDAIASLVKGDAFTPFDEAHAHLGVGTSSAAFAKTQTDLQGTSVRKPVQATYPKITGNEIEYRASFGPSEANFAWHEWGIFNAPTSGTMMMREIESLGTKVAGQTWVLKVNLTVDSAGAQVMSVGSIANGPWSAGQTMDIILTFPESITVSGTPSLPLDFNGTIKNAVYMGGSGTSNITFSYVIESGLLAAAGEFSLMGWIDQTIGYCTSTATGKPIMQYYGIPDTTLVVVNASGAGPVSADLVAEYKLYNEAAGLTNSAGAGSDLTVYCPNPIDAVEPLFMADGVLFDEGGTGRLQTSEIPLDFSTAMPSYTLETWVLVNDLGNNYDCIAGFAQDGSPWGYALSWRINNGKFQMDMNGSGHSDAANPASTNITLREWTHVVATYDSTTKIARQYFNGVGDTPVDYSSDPFETPGAITKMTLGYDNYNGESMCGKMGEFRIYSSALSEEQVLNNYNVTKERYPVFGVPAATPTIRQVALPASGRNFVTGQVVKCKVEFSKPVYNGGGDQLVDSTHASKFYCSANPPFNGNSDKNNCISFYYVVGGADSGPLTMSGGIVQPTVQIASGDNHATSADVSAFAIPGGWSVTTN